MTGVQTDTMTADQDPHAALNPIPLSLMATDFARFSQRLGASFEAYGFAVVSELFEQPNLPLNQSLVTQALEVTKRFFALDEADKCAYQQKGSGGARGYTPFGIETAKGHTAHDLKEFWHMGRPLEPNHPYRALSLIHI